MLGVDVFFFLFVLNSVYSLICNSKKPGHNALATTKVPLTRQVACPRA